MSALIVDDDAAIRELMAGILRGDGFGVTVAADAEAALAADRRGRGPAPLLVTDLELPGRDGSALAAALGGAHPDLRVLFVSGRARPVSPPAHVRWAFLAKPFHVDQFRAAARELISRG